MSNKWIKQGDRLYRYIDDDAKILYTLKDESIDAPYVKLDAYKGDVSHGQYIGSFVDLEKAQQFIETKSWESPS